MVGQAVNAERHEDLRGRGHSAPPVVWKVSQGRLEVTAEEKRLR